MKSIDIIGLTFGRLRVVKEKGSDKHGRKTWECVCNCGNTIITNGRNLRSGITTSCGCYRSEAALKAITKHGYATTSLYNQWHKMKDRCLNTKNKDYNNYGGRGITISDEWKTFDNYLRDMGHPPFEGACIDRIDNSKGYSKENCRWVDIKTNNRNRRTNTIIELNGESHPIVVWCEKLSLSYSTVMARMQRGWTKERWLNVPKSGGKYATR